MGIKLISSQGLPTNCELEIHSDQRSQAHELSRVHLVLVLGFPLFKQLC